jgi:tetratricopeptide (TPR) repeat protein
MSQEDAMARIWSRFTLAVITSIVLSPTNTRAQPSPRFDELVRADFFAGIGGDEARLAKAMKLCEDTLAKAPRHAEAMAWHGSGLLFRAGQAFQRGNVSEGTDLWGRGLKEMDTALSLDPNNVGVLIPRGATFLEVTKHMPRGEEQRGLLQQGLAAYEKTLATQQPYFSSLSVHAKGELLLGLADGWDRAGDKAKARLYYERILKECPGSSYAERALAWLRG